MGYKSLRMAKPGLDSPTGGPPPLKLDFPVTISFSGFIGVPSRVTGFYEQNGLHIVGLGLLSPIVIGGRVVGSVMVLTSDVRWKPDSGYEVDLNGDTPVAFSGGGVW